MLYGTNEAGDDDRWRDYAGNERAVVVGDVHEVSYILAKRRMSVLAFFFSFG